MSLYLIVVFFLLIFLIIKNKKAINNLFIDQELQSTQQKYQKTEEELQKVSDLLILGKHKNQEKIDLFKKDKLEELEIKLEQLQKEEEKHYQSENKKNKKKIFMEKIEEFLKNK